VPYNTDDGWARLAASPDALTPPAPATEKMNMTDPLPGSDGYIGTPRWVKVLVVIAAVVLLLLVIVLLMGGGPGGHGPDRHAP
jgi:hypothetical protein